MVPFRDEAAFLEKMLRMHVLCKTMVIIERFSIKFLLSLTISWLTNIWLHDKALGFTYYRVM